MPRTGGVPAGNTSNLDPLQIFNAPSPVPQRGGGAGISAAQGIFDAFIPRSGGNGIPAQTPTTFDPASMYGVSMPTEIGGRLGLSTGAPAGYTPQHMIQQPQVTGPAQPYQPATMPNASILPPPINFGTGAVPQFPQMPQQPQMDSAAAQWMANLMGNNQYLVDIAKNGIPTSLEGSYLQKWAENGQPVNALPAWQSYVDAMQRGIQGNQANLMEMFNSTGGYQSTSFGNAAVDYMAQTAKDQNALLAQMGYQSLSDALGRQFQAGGTYDSLKASLAEAAAGRQYGAASQLGQQAYGAGSTLTNMDFQSQMAQYQAGLQAAMLAAQQAGGLQSGALSQLGGYGAQSALQLLQNAMSGTGALFGGSQNALNNMFNASNNVPNSLLSAFLTQQGQGVQGYSQLMNSYLQNLGLGSQMGGQQYNTLQGQLGALYQEWLRTQSQYNPLLPYLFQGATGYVPTQQTSSPGFWDYFSGILGGGLGALGGIAAGGGFGALFSDERMKENVVPIGHIKDVPLYEFEYIGFPGKHIGTMAQQIADKHPTAVSVTPEGTYIVDYGQLANELLLTQGVN